ncbi:MAG: hypothetical protein K6B14_00850, partial [Lachnospiraceae bacterium]|nr:hypothetical protein [Lachnospiraceae bacterium]
MAFLDRLFGKRRSDIKSKGYVFSSNDVQSSNENVARLYQCREFILDLLQSDQYIARSDYNRKISEYTSDISFFNVLKTSGMLKEFCERNGISYSEIEKVIDDYENIQDLVDRHNDDYVNSKLVEQKDYLDSILNAVDKSILLDD